MWVKDMAAAQAAMAAHAWTPPLLSGLVERMKREHVEKCFGQCAKAYSLISAEHLARTIGVTAAKVSEMADAAHWTTDAETGKIKYEVQGSGGSGGEIFENEFSGMIKDEKRAKLAYDYSLEAVKDFL